MLLEARRCKTCELEKPPSEFYVVDRSTGRLSSECKECKRERSAKYRQEHPDKVSEVKKQWYERNRDRVKANVRRNRVKNLEYYRHYDRSRVRTDERRAYARSMYRKHKEKRLAYQRRVRPFYIELNRQRMAAMSPAERKAYYRRTYERKRQIGSPQLYYQHNKDRFREYQRQWRLQNRERARAIDMRRRARIKGLPYEHIDRVLIIQRDNYTCYLCGLNMIERPELIRIDHVVPVSKGGPTTYDNLRVACQPCNSRKAAKLLDEYLDLATPVLEL